MEKITAVVITFNEEENIGDCFESISFTNEIIVADSKSKDRTIEIAKDYTDKIFTGEWNSYSEKRLFAISKAANEWILVLDADERISSSLKEEILSLSPAGINSFYIKRKNYYLGKWIKHGGLYPDYHLRLFKKNEVKLNKRIVHEGFEPLSKFAYLKNDILHYSYNDINSIIAKSNVYSSLQAQEFYSTGKSTNKLSALISPFLTFLRVYFVKGTFKDKFAGFMAAFNYFLTGFFTYLKLLKLQKKI